LVTGSLLSGVALVPWPRYACVSGMTTMLNEPSGAGGSSSSPDHPVAAAAMAVKKINARWIAWLTRPPAAIAKFKRLEDKSAERDLSPLQKPGFSKKPGFFARPVGRLFLSAGEAAQAGTANLRTSLYNRSHVNRERGSDMMPDRAAGVRSVAVLRRVVLLCVLSVVVLSRGLAEEVGPAAANEPSHWREGLTDRELALSRWFSQLTFLQDRSAKPWPI
jgi:hypothetical protein